MKEIRILMQQLRSYPDNFFVVPQVPDPGEKLFNNEKDGLVVCDMDGTLQGFIETGGKEGVVIQ